MSPDVQRRGLEMTLVHLFCYYFDYSRAGAYCACSRCGWGWFGHFYSHLSFPLSPSLWETARYRLKYCLKGPLNPKQPTNQPSVLSMRNSDCHKSCPHNNSYIFSQFYLKLCRVHVPSYDKQMSICFWIFDWIIFGRVTALAVPATLPYL